MSKIKCIVVEDEPLDTKVLTDYISHLNVTDYLLKPFEFERFLVAVNKVKAVQGEQQKAVESKEKDFIFLNVQKKKVKILFSEILYIESQREYIKIVTTKKEFISKMSTHEIESLLPSDLFKRYRKSVTWLLQLLLISLLGKLVRKVDLLFSCRIFFYQFDLFDAKALTSTSQKICL